ncbi:MAG: hypothetical protein R3B90_17735 [Planctomycetaceae bacterium]
MDPIEIERRKTVGLPLREEEVQEFGTGDRRVRSIGINRLQQAGAGIGVIEAELFTEQADHRGVVPPAGGRRRTVDPQQVAPPLREGGDIGALAIGLFAQPLETRRGGELGVAEAFEAFFEGAVEEFDEGFGAGDAGVFDGAGVGDDDETGKQADDRDHDQNLHQREGTPGPGVSMMWTAEEHGVAFRSPPV